MANTGRAALRLLPHISKLKTGASAAGNTSLILLGSQTKQLQCLAPAAALLMTLPSRIPPQKRLAHTQARRRQDSGDANQPTGQSPLLPPTAKPRMVIFDKNGTLIDFHAVWTPWVQSMAERLERATGMQLKHRVYEELDFCHFSNKTRPGILAHGTTWEIKHELEDLLCEMGLSRQEAQLKIEECWEDVDINSTNTLQTESNLKHIFEALKERRIKIGVCTSDTRASTERTLHQLNIDPYVDVLVCGDDLGSSRGKLTGHHIQRMCDKFDLQPSEVVLVGDTCADMEMGRKARVGMNIGVLTGIGCRLDLSPQADHIVDNIKDILPLLLTSRPEPQVKRLRQLSGDDRQQDGKRASLIIFDKDGTLICFHTMWTPWAEALIKRLEQETQLDLRHKVLEELGYCLKSRKWTPGILAECTTGQNQERIIEMLQDEGLNADEAASITRKVWRDSEHTNDKYLKTLDDPIVLFRTLKEFGVKVAICTADARQSTEEFVKKAGLAEYIDYMVCGDDLGSVPKPSPHNALVICEKLGVDPTEAVVIGDTIADLGMGRSAKLGATVAVLSGVGGVKDLDAHADHIVPSIKHLLPIVLPPQHKEIIQKVSTSKQLQQQQPTL